MSSISDILTRQYSNFRGVDFTGGLVLNGRSPEAVNMWKDYNDDDCIQTRPGMKLLNSFDNEVFGLFFYKINNYTHVLVHSGTKLLEWTNYPSTPAETSQLWEGLNPSHSRYFIYDNIFFFMDGINYLEYDGKDIKEVEGTIPMTSYWKNPDGSTSIDSDTDLDYVLQPINVLTPLRKNSFIADGSSTQFQLDTGDLDSINTFITKAYINDAEMVENIGFTLDRAKGIVKFDTAPSKDDKVVVLFSKTISGHRTRIENCLLSCEFDNRIFFSGNKDYPNAVFHCELNDPRYIRDNAYYECGMDLSLIKALVPGNNVLWVFKEINQNSSSVYYLNPTLDSTYSKIYPSVSGSIALGCESTGLNFNDDIVFFSNNGLEAISSSSLYSEQILQHRSSLVDTKMLNEINYKNVVVTEYKGYLLCLMDSHIYLADSRKRYQSTSNDIEYEWFYWELPFDISYIREYRNELYLGNSNGELFILEGTTDNEQDIYSEWTTAKEDFGYASYTKTTNKRGNTAELKQMNNDEIKLSTVVDGTLKEKNVFNDSKGYIAYRIKDKKFKNIQLKFSSNKPFGLFSCTLQAFVAGYIKR